MSDYPNSGNLFSANHMQVFRAGTVDIDGSDHEIAVIEVTTKKGDKMYLAYKEVGVLYVNRQKSEEKDWDISGEIEVNGEKFMAWGRKRFDKNNNTYSRFSFKEAKPKDTDPPKQSQPASTTPDGFDDAIPF